MLHNIRRLHFYYSLDPRLQANISNSAFRNLFEINVSFKCMLSCIPRRHTRAYTRFLQRINARESKCHR